MRGKREAALQNFEHLKAERDAIHQEIGRQLHWIDQGEIRVAWRQPGVSADRREEWPEQHRHLCDALERMYAVFRPRIRKLATAE